MKSAWYEYKNEAVYLRQHGLSVTYIEDKLGVPRSTLSEWFKVVALTAEQKNNLQRRKAEALKTHQAAAQAKAAAQRREQEAARDAQARQAAESTLSHIDITEPAVQTLALAMVYRGGTKDKSVIISSSHPIKLKCALTALKTGYRLAPEDLEVTLRLSPDHDDMAVRSYWADELGIPIENFTGVITDKRSHSSAGGNLDMGVCLLRCNNIALQRKLSCLYNLFCERASTINPGD